MDRTSYMLVVPNEEEELNDPAVLLQRVEQIDGVQVMNPEMEQEELSFELIYNETLYRAKIYPVDFELPEFYRTQHFFPDVEIEAVEEKNCGLAVELEFAGEALLSYHLQLKMIAAMFSCGVLAVVDDSAEKILSGRWLELAAASQVPPAPRYLFTVQAVSDEGDEEVWLHTHGLNRCGVTELEILGSTRENYNEHYHIIETMAKRLLESEEPLEPLEPLFLARLSEEAVLVTTLLSWEQAVELYDEDCLGGKADRKEDHNQDTSCIFCYPSPEDLEQKRPVPVSVFDELLADNPLYMISNGETARMKALAQERISYMKRALGEEDVHILVKLGLEVDEEYVSEDNQREHIWFELQEISDVKLKAELTQEPFYIKGLHAGYVGEYSIDMITDWMIYLPEGNVTPDDVYLLEMLKAQRAAAE